VSVRRDFVDLFGTGGSGNVSINLFWRVKGGDASWFSTMNVRCAYENDILAVGLFEEN
jgi:hypothetical protein